MEEMENREKTPAVSVIMPVHNGVEYVEAAANSVLAQTFKDFELILVDDGATDGSGALCDAIAARDARVRVIHRENGGVSAARNAGMDCARGEYLAFIDHDDCYLPSFLEKMVGLICQTGVQLVRCGRLHITTRKNGEITDINHCYVARQEVLTNARFAQRFLEFKSKKAFLYPVWNALYRRDFVTRHNIRFPEELRFGSEDVTFNYRMYLAGTDVAFLPDMLYVHYVHIGQSTSAAFHPELIPVNTKLANLEYAFVQKAAGKKAGMLRYYRFDELLRLVNREPDKRRRMQYAMTLARELPLKDFPLQYRSEGVRGRVMRLWLRLYAYRLYLLHVAPKFYGAPLEGR